MKRRKPNILIRTHQQRIAFLEDALKALLSDVVFMGDSPLVIEWDKMRSASEMALLVSKSKRGFELRVERRDAETEETVPADHD